MSHHRALSQQCGLNQVPPRCLSVLACRMAVASFHCRRVVVSFCCCWEFFPLSTEAGMLAQILQSGFMRRQCLVAPGEAGIAVAEETKPLPLLWAKEGTVPVVGGGVCG